MQSDHTKTYARPYSSNAPFYLSISKAEKFTSGNEQSPRYDRGLKLHNSSYTGTNHGYGPESFLQAPGDRADLQRTESTSVLNIDSYTSIIRVILRRRHICWTGRKRAVFKRRTSARARLQACLAALSRVAPHVYGRMPIAVDDDG